MKKIVSVLLCLTMVMQFIGCVETNQINSSTNIPSQTDIIPQSHSTGTASRDEYTEDGKPILYIGAFSSGSYEITEAFRRLELAVIVFNSPTLERETKHEARIIDYGDASVPEALFRINTEIIAGQMPDVLLTHGMPVDSYAAQGALYDMNAWFNHEDFFTGPFEAMHTNDKLYEISPVITVTTFYGLSSNLRKSGNITLDELYAAWERFNDGSKSFIMGLSNEQICYLLIAMTESQFVNEGTATCNFDSPEFIRFLEFCKSLPDKNKVNESWYIESLRENSNISTNTWFRSSEFHTAIKIKSQESF